MGLLQKYGVPTPRGSVAKSSQEAFEVAKKLRKNSFFVSNLCVLEH